MKRELAIMNGSGDTKLIWDSENEDEVENAKETFNRLTKKGYAAFSVNTKGKQDEVIKKFDANAERIILIPPMAGGV